MQFVVIKKILNGNNMNSIIEAQIELKEQKELYILNLKEQFRNTETGMCLNSLFPNTSNRPKIYTVRISK